MPRLVCPRCGITIIEPGRLAAARALQLHLRSHTVLTHFQSFCAGLTEKDRDYLRVERISPAGLEDPIP